METFFDLLKDPAHWEFEIFLMEKELEDIKNKM